MTDITLRNLTKVYDNADEPAVDDLTLEIRRGELVAFLGPSGCGKTTTLKMIAGLQPVTAGDVLFDGQVVTHIKPEKRGVVMVYQNYLLFPFMNVEENVGFGLRMRHEEKRAIAEQVAEMLALVKLHGLGKRRPHELSGGQKQRVALARALVVRPRVLLLDEPLSNLDAHLRDEMRDLIMNIYREFDVTIVFVTHDQQEAVQLADRVAVMFKGQLQQYGPSQDFYERPASARIASFFGNYNHIAGTKRGTIVSTAVGEFRVRSDLDVADGPVLLTIRPEFIERGTGTENSFRAPIHRRLYMGTHARLRIDVGGSEWDAIGGPHIEAGYNEGRTAAFTLPAEKIWLLPHNLDGAD